MTGSEVGISWLVASFLLINATLGAGLLNFPVAYNRLGGILIATIIQLFVIVMMLSTMLTLVFCAILYRQKSYHGVMFKMCGNVVMKCSATTVVITCFGVCVTLIIVMGDQSDRLFATHLGPHFCSKWYANRYFVMSVLVICIISPLCYFKKLGFLEKINFLGIIASLYIVVLAIYNYYKRDPKTLPKVMKTSPDNGMEFFASLPIIFFSYQSHEFIITVHSEMSDKSFWAFTKSMLLSLGVLLLLYCLAGTFGNLTFGDTVTADVIMMYDAGNVLVTIGIVALIVKLHTTYPLLVFCGRDTIVRLMRGNKNSSPETGSEQKRPEVRRLHAPSFLSIATILPDSSEEDDEVQEGVPREAQTGSGSNIVHATITTIWNLSALILALITPNISIAIGCLGALASSNVFIFPGMALVSLAWQYRRKRKKSDSLKVDNIDNNRLEEYSFMTGQAVQWSLIMYGIFIVAMGVLMGVIVIWQMIRDLRNPTLSHQLCTVKSFPFG